MIRRSLLFSILSLLIAHRSLSQVTDSTKQKAKADTLNLSSGLFGETDSLSIFELIDSLLTASEKKESGSALAARFGYNSNVVSSGRPFGFDQFGLTSGISYYHKTGLYVDATGYWSQQYDPNYYLTIASVGYFNSYKKWTYNLEYSRYYYNTPSGSDVYNPYTNFAGLSNFFYVKPFIFRFDYSVYFGEKSAQRLMPAVMLNLTKKNWLGFTRVSFFPSVTVLFGTEVIDLPPKLKILTLKPFTYTIIRSSKTEFGVMNYSFSFPLSLTLKNWNFLMSYSYNIPKALPDEQISLTNNGYITVSVSRYFNFKSSFQKDFLTLPK